VVGRALSPPALVVVIIECTGCGYTSLAPPPSVPAEHKQAVDTRRIERLVKEALNDLHVTAELLGVMAIANGWEITIQRQSRQIDRFFVESGPLVEMGAAIRTAVAGPAPAI